MGKKKTFGITKPVAGSPGFLKISEKEFEETLSIMQNLLEVLYWEEKFGYLISNFIELEKELLSIATEDKNTFVQGGEWMSEKRVLVSRRLVNLFTTAKLYVDHSSHHFSSIYGRSSKVGKFFKISQKILSAEELSFRASQQLRNYVQHRGFPIHSLKFGGRAIDFEDFKGFAFSCTPVIDPAKLESDPKFSSKIARELKSFGENIDLRPIIHKYIECLACLHERTRDLLSEDIKDWEEKISSAFTKYQKKFKLKDPVTYLSLVIGDDHRYKEIILFSIRAIERRKLLEKKNSNYQNFSERYVTGQLEFPKYPNQV